MKFTATKETEMTATQNIDWNGYIRFTDEEFEFLARAGVESHRIERMKETRDRFDAENK